MIYLDGIIYSLQKSGGISVYFDNLILSLNNSGISFKIDLLDNSLSNFKLSIRKKNIFLREKNYFERIRNCSVPENSLLFHSSYYRIPDKKNVPVITTVHDFIHEKFFNTPKSKIFSYIKKKAILNSTAIICVSEQTRNDLLYYVPEAKSKNITVIPNGVSPFFKNLNFEKSEYPFFLYVGTNA